nr:hypothetical protein [Micromonospora sp. DSM 115978]
MAAQDGIAGGSQTTRLSADERDAQIRAERDADALRYLTARGLDDVAQILGLVESPPPDNPREGVRRKVAIRKGRKAERCRCGKPDCSDTTGHDLDEAEAAMADLDRESADA